MSRIFIRLKNTISRGTLILFVPDPIEALCDGVHIQSDCHKLQMFLINLRIYLFLYLGLHNVKHG